MIKSPRIDKDFYALVDSVSMMCVYEQVTKATQTENSTHQSKVQMQLQPLGDT